LKLKLNIKIKIIIKTKKMNVINFAEIGVFRAIIQASIGFAIG